MTNANEGESLAAQLQEALAQLQALGLKVANLEARLQAGETPTAPSTVSSGGLDFLDRHRHLHLPGQAHERPTNTNGSAADRLRHPQGRPPAGDSAAAASAAVQPRPPEAEVPMSATRMVMAQIVSPGDSLGLDICNGGTVLSWIDICAGLAAKTFARGPCVTASVDAVHFLRPCHVGSVVIIAAMVNRTFRSSMEVGVRVEEEDPRTGARHHCCSAYLTFVALSRKDPAGGPPTRLALPKVVPTDRYHEQIHSEAARRCGRAVGLCTEAGGGGRLALQRLAGAAGTTKALLPCLACKLGDPPSYHSTAYHTPWPQARRAAGGAGAPALQPGAGGPAGH
jgi:acyl-CoA thioesterase 11